MSDPFTALNVRNRTQRHTLANQIITHARRLTDIPTAEQRAGQLIGPRGNSDPNTGTAPTSGRHYYEPPDPDPARIGDDLDALDHQLREANAALDLAIRIIDRILHVPTPDDFNLTAQNRPADQCEFHWSVGAHEWAHTKAPTDVAGTLPTPRVVCEACWNRIKATGKQPTRDDLEFHRLNGKWKYRTDNKRKAR